MSASLTTSSIPGAMLRLGREGAGTGPVQWRMQRNCALAPRQVVAVFASLAALSAAIGLAFWSRGATLVLPFAVVEVAALAVALLVYARHAADGESIRLADGRLTVEQQVGRATMRVEFAQPAWVRVEPEGDDRSLVELSGQGRRVVVGRHLRPELRRQLADEIRWALRRPAAQAA